MKTVSLLLVFCCYGVLQGFSQVGSIRCTAERNAVNTSLPPDVYTTVPTVFHVQETVGQLFSFQQYTAVYPKEVIAKELSKRKKRNWDSNKRHEPH